MATIAGTSSSCIGLISIAANSSSRLTLDTRTYLAGEFQIFPRLALIARRAQQICGMIRHNQAHPGATKMVHLPAQAPQGDVGAQWILEGDAPPRQHDLGLEQSDLLLEVGQPFAGLARRGIAIAGRPGF